MINQETEVKLIEYSSQEFQQACQLRYELFFAEHKLSWNVVQNKRQAEYFHSAIVIGDAVVAYGQLVPHKNHIYQICQMVVKPKYQSQNLGSKILVALIDIARKEGAIALTLNARLTAVGFYQKLGFRSFGKPFPSVITGVKHIIMSQKLQ